MAGDEADQAQAQIEVITEMYITAARNKATRTEKHPEFDGVHCIDCDIEIPEARLALGKVRCIECQTKHEKDTRWQS